MGSNHDWVSQSHQCYHYTIGQEEGSVGVMARSSSVRSTQFKRNGEIFGKWIYRGALGTPVIDLA